MGQKALVKIIKFDRADAEQTIKALRLQAKAWRILALIGIADQDAGRRYAQWLFFNTVPFVNGPAIEKFIAENEGLAETSGIKAGVFTVRKAAGT
jgi:hypothetical protein